VVDLAHYSAIDRARFQPLSAALTQHGLELRFWLPTVDTTDIEQITDFPDQSEDLAQQLADAGGLVVISPFFLYTPAEIAVVERFIADGGRLLVISDPDLESDAASDTNQLASVFNVVFNDDYLYDTVANDENFTYFFQGEFLEEAAALDGSKIAFYGGRSIGGAVATQVRSAATTLSSLRNGLTSFDTVVLGGTTAGFSTGRVLAMSDFDVLTDPYVARHDNRRMLQFVADFFANATRDNHLVDFPGFLGKEVALAIDTTEPVGALSLAAAAELQRVLEASGRQLLLGAAGAYTETAAGNGPDLIYVAGYRAAGSQTDLLDAIGLDLVEEIVTPTVTALPASPALQDATPAARESGAGESQNGELPPVTPDLPRPEELTPQAPPEVPPPLITPDVENATPASMPLTATPAPVEKITTPIGIALPTTATADAVVQFGMQQELTPGAGTPTPAAAFTATATTTATAIATVTAAEASTPEPVSAAPVTSFEPAATSTPEPTPQVRLLLDRGDGLRLLADETLLYIRRTHPSGAHTLAVLGSSETAINAAVTRLLNRDFSGCLAEPDLVLCPYSPGSQQGERGEEGAVDQAAEDANAAADSVTPTPDGGTSEGDTPSGDDPGGTAAVLVVDDNTKAANGEPSEAAIYLVALTAAGYQLDNWVTGEQGMPTGADLQPYSWVIWSDAGYAASGIEGESLLPIGEYINQGGRLTISSRIPFFGVGAGPASVVKDIVVTNEIPQLVTGLPTTPILLTGEAPVLTPLEENPDPSAGARTALARGPASADTGAPLLILLNDDGFEEPKGARLLLFGLSMGWLPTEVSTQLIGNMADLMLAE
jgi:hypothetical protein